MPDAWATPAALRAAIAAGRHTGPTSGLVPGYVQCNVVILPAADADDFAEFCRLNDQACPLVDRTPPGDPCIRMVIACTRNDHASTKIPTPPVATRSTSRAADLRIHVPRYRVFRNGVAQEHQPTDIRDLWRDDLVGFLLGCSFTFERALLAAGLPLRHLEEGKNVSMYRTNIPCREAGPFHGPLVVSMRPFLPEQAAQAREITARYPKMHGPPVHVGEPQAIGIADLSRPDFGDAVTIRGGEVPVFWACGVTPQLALENAQCELAITHSPGCMFVTDLRDAEFCVPT